MTITPNNQPQPNGNGQILQGLPGSKKPEDMTPAEGYINALNELAKDSKGQVTLTPENGFTVKLSAPIETHEGKTGAITINPPTGIVALKFGQLTHPDGSTNWEAQMKALVELTGLDEIILSKLPVIDMNVLLQCLNLLMINFNFSGKG